MKTKIRRRGSFLRIGTVIAVMSLLGGAWPRLEAQEELLEDAQAIQESRTKGLKELQDRIQNFGFLKFARILVDKLEGRERKVDPFGMAMDPEEELATLVVESVEAEEEEIVKTSLEEALSKFKVTGIFPKRKEVMIGAQTLRIGDRVMIKHLGTEFQLLIAGIDSQEVRLRDVDTGEEASVTHGLSSDLPAGMHRKNPNLAGGKRNYDTNTIVPIANRLITLE